MKTIGLLCAGLATLAAQAGTELDLDAKAALKPGVNAIELRFDSTWKVGDARAVRWRMS